MELNRNHFFAMGTILIFLGIQFRYVDSFVLNQASSQFVEERFGPGDSQYGAVKALPALFSSRSPVGSLRTIKPPRWLAWSLISVGAVFLLHSLAMRRPD